LEYGTPNMVGVAALWAGQNWLEENGVESIHAREMKLAQRLVEGLRSIDGLGLYCCDTLENHLSTLTFNLEGIEAGDVGVMLDVDYDIATRTGLHCAPLVHQQLGTVEIHGGVRISIGAFNTEAHIDAAIQALTEISRWVAQRKSARHREEARH
jgi:selenocysteine lyase/cysteine desulfurase